MKMKALFSVPEGQKVTEKQMHRVLLTSICSILLCMSCLAGSTWAWFAASVENTDNEILIAQPGVVLKIGDTTYIDGTTLTDTECKIGIEHANEKDVFEQKSTLHVVVKVQSGDEEIQRHTILNEENGYTTEITILNESGYVFTIDAVAYWRHDDVPSDVEPIGEDNIIRITAGESADGEEEPAEPPTTEPDETETTEPTDPTDPSVPETSNPDDNEGNNEGEGAGNGTGNNGAANGDDTTGSNNGGNTEPDDDDAADGEGGENPGSGDTSGGAPGSANPSGSDNNGNTEAGGGNTTDPDDSGNTEIGDDTTTGTNPEDPTNPTSDEET